MFPLCIAVWALYMMGEYTSLSDEEGTREKRKRPTTETLGLGVLVK